MKELQTINNSLFPIETASHSFLGIMDEDKLKTYSSNEDDFYQVFYDMHKNNDSGDEFTKKILSLPIEDVANNYYFDKDKYEQVRKDFLDKIIDKVLKNSLYSYEHTNCIYQNLITFGYDYRTATPQTSKDFIYVIAHDFKFKNKLYHKGIFINQKYEKGAMDYWLMVAFVDDLLNNYTSTRIVVNTDGINLSDIQYIVYHLNLPDKKLIDTCLKWRSYYNSDRSQFLQLVCSDFFGLKKSFVLKRINEINLDEIMKQDNNKSKRKRLI